MAIVEQPPEPLALRGPATVTPDAAYGVFRRPVATTGWKSWLFTIDHKKIGIMYGAAALFFFVVGGIEALLIRLQLAQPDGKLLSADTYNQMFTMHATTMVFLVVMPMAAAFGNYLVPLQIGARDVAFPRLNSFGFWAFFFGGVFLNLSWFMGGAPDGGWFAYAPNTGVPFSPTHGMDFWVLALQITGLASLTGAINLIVTILNMRAPGMSLMRMPVLSWMILVVQFLLVFAIPVITVALVLLNFQRLFGATFFSVDAGADPLLWQHLFWIFGHPEVYILVLPSFGIVSEVLPVFSRKPLFGYPFVVFSGVAIGFMGWGVWAHHMFASGIGPGVGGRVLAVDDVHRRADRREDHQLDATMWGGRLRFTTSMLFAIGLIVEFTIGGLSGVTHAISPSDTQQTDTYYIVAHFHYVLFGGAIFGIFAGFYYWWPKIFGRMLSEKLGKWNFWLMVIGINLTFGPMHIVGLQGQSRRNYRVDPGHGREHVELRRDGRSVHHRPRRADVPDQRGPHEPRAPQRPAGPLGRTHPGVDDGQPAEGRTTSTPSRPCTRIDEFFHRKYEEDEETGEFQQDRHGGGDPGRPGSPRRRAHAHAVAVVLAVGPRPRPARGRLLASSSTSSSRVVGALLIIAGVYGWAQEPLGADQDDYDPPS